MDKLNLSPEEELLLYCSRLSISDEIKLKIEEIMSNELDWDFILQFSGRQGISPLFYWNLTKINIDKSVPSETMMILEKRYYGNLARNMLLYDELGKVLNAFKKMGIETVVLKGAFLAEEIYKNIGLRPMSDIDLLIKKEDFQRAKIELERLNYSPTVIFRNKLYERFQTAWNEELSFIHQNKKIVVEIHWDIQPPDSYYKIEINKFWSNTRSVKIAGIETLTFAPEDILQHLCLHLDKHINVSTAPSARPLRDYCDIAEVIRYYKELINWKYLLTSSKNSGIEKPVYQSLSIANKYFGALVPENILSKIEPVNLNIIFYDILKGTVEINPIKTNQVREISYIMNLRQVDGICNKILILCGDVFPSKEYMIYHYSIRNKEQVYRYYLIHLGVTFQLGLAMLWQLPRRLLRYAFSK